MYITLTCFEFWSQHPVIYLWCDWNIYSFHGFMKVSAIWFSALTAWMESDPDCLCVKEFFYIQTQKNCRCSFNTFAKSIALNKVSYKFYLNPTWLRRTKYQIANIKSVLTVLLITITSLALMFYSMLIGSSELQQLYNDNQFFKPQRFRCALKWARWIENCFCKWLQGASVWLHKWCR